MSLLRINRNPGTGQLRVFAAAWFLCFGLLAIVIRAKGHPLASLWVGGVAVMVPTIGLAAPKMLRLVYLGMTYATFPIGWVISHVILAAVYFLVLTPMGLILRLFRYDPLTRRFDRATPSYWKLRGGASPAARYFRQH